MDMKEVVAKALNDPDYAERLRKAGQAAVAAGAGSSEHDALLAMFAIKPSDLRTAKPPIPGPKPGGGGCGLGTSALVGALVGALNGITTGHCT